MTIGVTWFAICLVNLSEDGKPKVIDIHFAPKYKGYTHLFAAKVIEILHKVKVQNTVAELMHTTPYVIRSIMESVVEKALLERGEVNDLEDISLDEKAYAYGHKYATILIDSDKNCVVEMIEGRKEKNVKAGLMDKMVAKIFAMPYIIRDYKG
ncbi:transposase (fragment) [Capnocytophaga canimorsus]